MTHSIELPDMLDRIKGVIYGDNPDVSDLEGMQVLWEARRACESIIAAARSLKAAADAEIAELLGANATRLDDSFLYTGPKKSMVVYNPDGLFDYLAADVRECFRVDDMRISSLRAVIEKRVRAAQPDLEDKAVKQTVAAIVNSFCDWEDGDTQLHVLPITRAPKYAAQLVHGEIKERKSPR